MKKINEQVVFKQPNTYHDMVLSQLKNSIPQKYSIDKNSFSAFDQIMSDIDKIFWNNYKEINSLIQKYQSEDKKPENCADEIEQKFFKTYTLKQLTLKFGQKFAVNVLVGTDGYLWKIEKNASIKFIEKTPLTNNNNFGAYNSYKYIFKVVGTEPGRLIMKYERPFDKQYCKEKVFLINVKI